MKVAIGIIIFIIIITIVFCIKYKVKIKWKTFLKRGFSPKRGNFGLYVYDGKQGKGKTYSLVEYLLDNRNSIEVFCNIKGIKNIDYFYYTGFKELVDIKHKLDNDTLIYDKEKQLVIVYDEIFTELTKKSDLNKEIIDFLCQMRKRKIIFLTTAQEWAEIPLSFRRFCRYEIQCNMINFLGLGILIKRFGDAEQMKWDEEQQEHTCPITETTITKCRKFISNSYDTFLRISSIREDVPTRPSSIDTEFWGNEKQEELEERPRDDTTTMKSSGQWSMRFDNE